jgi:hypothetical protein
MNWENEPKGLRIGPGDECRGYGCIQLGDNPCFEDGWCSIFSCHHSCSNYNCGIYSQG